MARLALVERVVSRLSHPGSKAPSLQASAARTGPASNRPAASIRLAVSANWAVD